MSKMKTVTIERGMIGGGLARLCRDARHEVDELGRAELGRDGGDASTADVVLIAVPGSRISAALAKVIG